MNIPHNDRSAGAEDSLAEANTEIEACVVVEPQKSGNEVIPPVTADPWASVKAFHARLASSGRTFGDSVELIREDRDR